MIERSETSATSNSHGNEKRHVKTPRGGPRYEEAEHILRLVGGDGLKAFEMVERRRSIPALWDIIYERLGEGVWEYLPPRIFSARTKR